MQVKIDNNLARKSNSLLILKEIMKQPLSRTDLAAKLCLTMGGLTPIIKHLISSELIIECKDLNHILPGRKPILLKINNNKFKLITLSISRNKYTLSIVNFGNIILETEEFYYKNCINTKKELLESISSNIDIVLEKHKIDGLSVTSPGPLDYQNGIILNPPNFNGWSNIKIKDALSKKNLPISIEHDVDSMAYAEKYMGSAQTTSKFININIDEGVGCGIFINDKNFRKDNRDSCEIGHMSINIFGEKCDCGNNGCLERYINTDTILTKINTSKEKYLNWTEVCNFYKDNDIDTKKIVDHSINILGSALISLLNILDLDLIILSGSFSLLGDSISQKLEKIVTSNIIFKGKNIKIVNSKLKDAKIIGSSILFFEDYLWNNNLF